MPVEIPIPTGVGGGGVDGDDGFCTGQFAELQELVGTEIVTPYRVSVIGHGMISVLSDGTDTVFPVVVVCTAAAGPTHRTDTHLAYAVDDILTDTVDILDCRILTYPDTIIDGTAKILKKYRVDISRYEILVFFLRNQFELHSQFPPSEMKGFSIFNIAFCHSVRQ